MTKEKAGKWALAGLIAAVVALAADDVVLHWRLEQARQETETRLELLEEEAEVSAAARAEQARGWWEKKREKWQRKWENWRK